MRASTAVLTDTTIRLWDLAFPYGQALVARTRAPYIALDDLITFSKQDRDGKVDAYLAAYLPDELVLLFFVGGELVNAALLNGRPVMNRSYSLPAGTTSASATSGASAGAALPRR